MFFFWCAEWRWNVFDALMATLSALSAVNSLLESVSGTNMSFLRSFRFIKVRCMLDVWRVTTNLPHESNRITQMQTDVHKYFAACKALWV